MKRFNFILAAAMLIAGASCVKSTPEGTCTKPQEGSKEVEINISTSGQSATRAPLDGEVVDAGNDAEREIATLDVLVLEKDGGYLYRREAYKVSTGVNTYRVMLEESDAPLDVLLFANSRDMIIEWEESADREGTSRTAIQTALIDTEPERLVWRDKHVPLPMYGFKYGQTIDDEHAPSKWGEVKMLRSVASVDLYVEETKAIKDTFQLTGLMAWFAPDMGYLAAIADTDPLHLNPQQYLSPAAMTNTTSKAVVDGDFYADSVKTYIVPGTEANGEDSEKTYKGIANQVYFYDNPAVSRSAIPNVRPTRIIVEGLYEMSEDVWQSRYYPIDIVYDDASYRPAIRNWKYEFKVTSISGPGYSTPGEAAEGAPIDLNVEIISWDKDDVQIGVKGHYYVTMNSKNATLFRDQGSNKQLYLDYEVLDDDPFVFDYDFKDDTWGTQAAITGGIENDYFTVKMIQTTSAGGGSVVFDITAKQAMNEDEEPRLEYVTVKVRELVFTINIVQINGSDYDWEDGGEIGVDL
jgi:hypothetical protein